MKNQFCQPFLQASPPIGQVWNLGLLFCDAFGIEESSVHLGWVHTVRGKGTPQRDTASTATVISGPISLIYMTLSALRQFLDLCIARARRCILFNRGLVMLPVLNTINWRATLFQLPRFLSCLFPPAPLWEYAMKTGQFSSADPQSLLTQIQSCEFLSSELVVSFFPTSSVWKSQPYRGLVTSLAPGQCLNCWFRAAVYRHLRPRETLRLSELLQPEECCLCLSFWRIAFFLFFTVWVNKT